MAGSLSLIESEFAEKPVSALKKNRWQISFSRFIVIPPPSSSSILVPFPTSRRRPIPRGTWISSDSTTAILQLSNYHSISDAIISVYFEDYVLEEHHVMKLHFGWPQVSCLSGYPPRGTRSVFVSYRDSLGVFQKFACRFRSVSESETFKNDLKDLMKDPNQTTPLNTEFQSEISSQSVFLSTSRSSSRVHAESTVTSPTTKISDEIPLNVSYEVEGDSLTNITAPTHRSESEFTALPSNFTSKMADFDQMILDNVVALVSCNAETTMHYNEGTSAALPPSFTSLLANCYHPEVNEDTALPSSSDHNDLKSEIARLMDDSSFQVAHPTPNKDELLCRNHLLTIQLHQLDTGPSLLPPLHSLSSPLLDPLPLKTKKSMRDANEDINGHDDLHRRNMVIDSLLVDLIKLIK